MLKTVALVVGFVSMTTVALAAQVPSTTDAPVAPPVAAAAPAQPVPASVPAQPVPAQAAPAKPAVAAAKPVAERKICVTEEVTGSRLGAHKICMTKAEFEERQFESRKILDDQTRNKLSDTP